MNRLINKTVNHRDLGEGIITKAEDADKGIFITVEFPTSGETKRFGFPIALGKILAPDEELQAIADDIARAKKEALRKAEEEKMTREEKILREKSEQAVKQAEKIINDTDWETVFTQKNFRIFKVHQGKTFDAEYKGRYVWAPTSGIHHHEKMTEIHTGDIIFHYAEGAIVAIGEAFSDCISFPQPSALYGHGWGNLGYRVNVRYQMLSKRFSLESFKDYIVNHKASSYSSFDGKGDACQGYMYELEYDIAKFLKTEIMKTPQSAGVVNVLSRIK